MTQDSNESHASTYSYFILFVITYFTQLFANHHLMKKEELWDITLLPDSPMDYEVNLKTYGGYYASLAGGLQFNS